MMELFALNGTDTFTRFPDKISELLASRVD